ncbi:ketose-bisphosphate aldolase [Candidatus Poribacteria bacterium]
MALENMKQMLWKAKDKHYAIGAFNILDYNSMKAVVQAAEELSAPVIIQTSAKTVIFWGYGAIMAWVNEIAGESKVPVALHLDHCKDVDLIKGCIDAGWTSVMIDASAQPFEDNMAVTRQVIEMAQPKDVTVEAELGKITGVEEDIKVADDESRLADPDEAVKFCAELSLDCFAPAIGTAHGIYKGEPKIAFDRLDEISRRTGLPIALHGGTGLSEEVFQKCISLGCAKVNISTQLKHAFIDEFVACHQEHQDYDPLKVIGAQFDRLKKEIGENIERFGGSGQA